MRAVAQRVRQARVRVRGPEGCETVAEMGEGVLALVGAARGDDERTADELARKLVHLRIFEDEEGRMNRSLLDVGGTLGVVSQFTLLADTRKGRRPSYAAAAPPEAAEPLIARVIECARSLGAPTVCGRFRARMEIELVNSGPVTLWLDTDA